MPPHRTTHAKLTVDPEIGEVESRELNVVSDVPADGKHTLLSLDFDDALKALDAADDEPPAAPRSLWHRPRDRGVDNGAPVAVCQAPRSL